MRMREIGYEGQRPVEGYGPGGFRIGESWLAGSLALTPGGIAEVTAPFGPEALAPILAEAEAIDVVLVGQGAEIAPLAPELRAALEGAGLGVEVMSTPSACRTYNVLLSEARRVAALLAAV